jgi:CRISPR/Cas system-associated endoribonuclease Cas2
VVLFDIPRRKNAERNAFRAELRRIGMEPLQASVFISRFSCRDEVQLLARLFSVGHCVYYFETDTLETFDTVSE